MQLLLVACSIAGSGWFFFHTGWSVPEIARALTGLLALWLPYGALIFLLVGRTFCDPLSRFTFSAIASFTLTTLTAFAFAVADLWVPGTGRLFYVTLVLTVIGACLWACRRGDFSELRRLRQAGGHIDWFLATLIVASLLVTARYKQAFLFNREDERYHLITHADQTYFAGIVYELARRMPPEQFAIRAGVPERAYHVFPHVTTMLVARFTGQDDAIRAQLVYVYTVIEILLCLALFCLARLLTQSRAVAYLAVALLFIGAIPLPRLVTENASECQYFTIWPHATTTIEPTIFTSPQMYAGMLVTFGVFLGVAALSLRRGEFQPSPGFILVLAAMVAALLRFRIHVFLSMFPAIMVLLAVLFWRTRQSRFLLAGGFLVAIVAALGLEMRSSIYLPSTSSLVIENTKLAFLLPTFNSWPGNGAVATALESYLHSHPAVFVWTWQIVCTSMFVFTNIIGCLMVVICGFYLCDHRPWHDLAPLTWLILWLVVSSVVGAICISTSYDKYSVGGQMPWHIGWYVTVWMAPGLWAVWQRLPTAWRAARGFWLGVGYSLLLVAFAWQLIRPASIEETYLRTRKISVSADDWAMLQFLHSSLPQGAVILANYLHYPERRALFTGVGGRRCFLECFPSAVEPAMLPDETFTVKYRAQRIVEVWNATSATQLRQALPPNVTHVVEYKGLPLTVHPSECLKQVWASPHGKVVIWEVVR